MQPVQMSACQIDIHLGDTARNCARIAKKITLEAKRGSRLVVFPECCLTGYGFASREEVAASAMHTGDENIGTLRDACEKNDVFAIVGFAESDEGRFYNTAACIGPGGFFETYRKLHIPFIGLDRFVEPGDQGFVVHDLPFGRVGVNICYDQNFPEFARILTLQGAQLVVLITNWPERSFGPRLINVRAYENQVFYMAVNRVGAEGGFRFHGQSGIIDCMGETLAAAGRGEETLRVTLDLTEADNKRIIHKPGEWEMDLVSDRRPDICGPLNR